GLEFALESHRHLLAQFVAQAAQLLGDLADDSEAFLLSAHPLNVAGDRLVTIWGAVGPHAFLAAWPSLGLPAAGIADVLPIGVSPRISGFSRRKAIAPAPAACLRSRALQSLFQRLEGAVELLQGGVRPALPAGIQCVEIGPLAVHRNARFRNGWRMPVFLRSLSGTKAARKGTGRSEPPGAWPALRQTVNIRYRLDTGNRQAHHSPNVVNKRLIFIRKTGAAGLR